MELITSLPAIAFALLPILFLVFLFRPRGCGYRLPPSPTPALPIIGHLYLLRNQPFHRTLQRLSQAHGPIIFLQFGVRRVVVVSSYDVAEECFTVQDIALANRPRFLANQYLGYNCTTIAGAPYGHHWRTIRRLGTQEFLSNARLKPFTDLRHDEVKKTMQSMLAACSSGSSKLEMRPKLFQLIFNIVTRMVVGKQYYSDNADSESMSGHTFQQMMFEVFQYLQVTHPGDFLPFLRWIDFRGMKKKLTVLGKRLDDFFQTLVDEQRRDKQNTVLGHLLSIQESDPECWTDLTMKGFVNNALLGGTETSATTIEWAMSVLLNHPEVLQKAKQEIDSKVGHDRLIEEQDLRNLPYLQSIILETLRMFVPGPLGLPHEAATDCKIRGYDVPQGTILLVNAWAIHRDPEVWDEPNTFRPERFQGKEFETHRMMPFGLGRRACPGMGLGQRMVGLALGSLIQCFDWERVGSEKVDLTEGPGLTLPKLKPLEVMIKPREALLKVLLQETHV